MYFHTSKLTMRALCLVATLCVAACHAQSSGQAAAPLQSSALQALVAKTKKNLKFVQGGSFQMGDFGMIQNKEKLPYYGALDTMPLHKVSLDSFSIAAYKTTYEDYDLYAEILGIKKLMQDSRDIYFKRRPAPAGVPWQAARDYCKWLSRQVGTPMDLPTEAQWEYAARNRGQFVVFATDNGKIEPGRNTPTYEWLEEHNNHLGVYASAVSMYEVGLFPPNPLGLYDLVSNGFDWTLDWYGATYYAKSPERNPTGPATGTEKVRRGNENMEPRGLEMRGMTMVRHSVALDAKYNDGNHIRCVANSPSKVE